MRNIFIILLLIISNQLFSQNWQTNFKTAQLEAQKSHKPIILVFSGSDWCAPCIKLDKEIFKSEYFISYSAEHFILLKADFPRKKQNALSQELQEQNRALAETYNKNGFFPFVIVLTPQGKILGEIGYEKTSPEAYVNKLVAFETK